MLAVTAISLTAAATALGDKLVQVREWGDPYKIAEQELRYQDARALLPPEGPVGYLSDLDRNEASGGALFYGAQYWLAPRILTEPSAAGWTLGNFARPADFAALGRARNLEVVRDFGNGVIVYRRAK